LSYYGILPEIIGKWYSHKPIESSDGIVPVPTIPSTTTNDNDEEDMKNIAL